MESNTHQAEIISQFTRQAQPFAENSAHSTNRSFDIFRELGQFAGQERVLDSGCGPGLVSRYLATFVGEVVGVDLTPAMIALARQAATEAGLSNTTFVEGDMTALPFAEGEFDAAITRYALHHLEEPAAAFAELVRVTRPDGRIIVVDATPAPAKRSAYDNFERLRDPSHTRALIHEELIALGQSHGLTPPRFIKFTVPMDVIALVDSSFPVEIARQQLIDLLTADLGRDALGFNVRREAGILRLAFPITAVAWRR